MKIKLPRKLKLDGVEIDWHIDFAFKHAGGIGVGEIKGWNDFSFNRAQKGEIEHDILCQGWTYHKAGGFDPILFLGFRKATSAMVEIVFSRNCVEKVVTQRLTGDPVELAKQDPILLTEIKSPFDDSVEEYVRERIKHLKTIVKHMSDHQKDSDFSLELLARDVKILVPGADAVEDEIGKVQGGEKAALLAKEGKEVIPLSDRKGNSWYSFKTGRQIAMFPCSYCGHMKRCYPQAQMEMKGEKPIWVLK